MEVITFKGTGNTNGCNIIVSVCYRHPKKASDNTFNVWLQDTLEKISKEHKIMIFAGDFNYNLLKYSQDKYVKEFVDTMASFNIQPSINKPTRIVKNQRPSLIDNFFTNAIGKDITTGNLVSKITDHMPNFIIMKNLTLPNNKSSNRTRSFKNYNVEEYRKDIDNIDITPILRQTEDLNYIYKYYPCFYEQG